MFLGVISEQLLKEYQDLQEGGSGQIKTLFQDEDDDFSDSFSFEDEDEKQIAPKRSYTESEIRSNNNNLVKNFAAMIGKHVKQNGQMKKANDTSELPRLIGTKSQASTAR